MMWLVVLSSVILTLLIWPGNTIQIYIYRNDGLGYLSMNSRNMFVGLLKCPNGSLESVQHPDIPRPRYSRKLTFWHKAQPIFIVAETCAHNLWSGVDEKE